LADEILADKRIVATHNNPQARLYALLILADKRIVATHNMRGAVP